MINSHVIILFQADEDGYAKSSKRSIQPLSSFTHFTKNDSNEYVLKNIKNRFGVTGFEIEMDYRPETTSVKEIKLNENVIIQKPMRARNEKRFS